jgi:hypothetical protein
MSGVYLLSVGRCMLYRETPQVSIKDREAKNVKVSTNGFSQLGNVLKSEKTTVDESSGTSRRRFSRCRRKEQ